MSTRRKQWLEDWTDQAACVRLFKHSLGACLAQPLGYVDTRHPGALVNALHTSLARAYHRCRPLAPCHCLQAWADRITHNLLPSLQGPLYFLWGTDWEDAPIVNARAL